eukprot:5127074-Pleurochrysis_carterae.AAC.5
MTPALHQHQAPPLLVYAATFMRERPVPRQAEDALPLAYPQQAPHGPAQLLRELPVREPRSIAQESVLTLGAHEAGARRRRWRFERLLLLERRAVQVHPLNLLPQHTCNAKVLVISSKAHASLFEPKSQQIRRFVSETDDAVINKAC